MSDNKENISLGLLFSEGSVLETDKCKFIQVGITDAEFIFNLRKNHNASFLRVSGEKIADQENYLQNYRLNFLNREEIYYKIWNKSANKFEAVVRLTELNNDKIFNWESLISIPGSDPTTPIEIMLTIYKVGFEDLGRDMCGPWDVNKDHFSMQKIHKLVGMAKPTSYDETYIKYSVKKDDYDQQKAKFLNLGFASNMKISQ